MYERILIPLDGSQEAEAAAHEVVHLSANPQVVHLQLVENGVMQSRQLEGYTVYADQIHDAHKRSGEAYLDPFRRMLGDKGLHVETSVTNGDPMGEVAERAEKLDADLVLLGAGEGGWLRRRTRLSNIAPRLAKKVKAHVLLVQGPMKPEVALQRAA
ncbi:MAG: universal stress protein [Nitrospinae bacterium]|nr:universal stress protein [Nitrospinota bacterium]